MRNQMSLENHFTRVPDEVFDNLSRVLTGNQFKVMMVIYRESYGRRSGDFAEISFSRFEEFYGISKSTAQRAIIELEEMKIIFVRRWNSFGIEKWKNFYRFNMNIGIPENPWFNKDGFLQNDYGQNEQGHSQNDQQVKTLIDFSKTEEKEKDEGLESPSGLFVPSEQSLTFGISAPTLKEETEANHFPPSSENLKEKLGGLTPIPSLKTIGDSRAEKIEFSDFFLLTPPSFSDKWKDNITPLIRKDEYMPNNEKVSDKSYESILDEIAGSFRTEPIITKLPPLEEEDQKLTEKEMAEILAQFGA